mmetsp:Transcript_100584/g.288819  ORF Transcript_100584/g.288819 Transcript_100584/m.288819 type:complete len:231 (-) Transcript_100584:41-733(-)
MATTQRLEQPCTGEGGTTRATAMARVSQSSRKQPPPELSTFHPGAKASAAESPPLPRAQEPSTWDQPSKPCEVKSTGWLMPSDSSTEATMSAPAPRASSTKRFVARLLQAPLAPRAATLHCQCTFQKKVDTCTEASRLDTSLTLCPKLGAGAAAVTVGCPEAPLRNKLAVGAAWLPAAMASVVFDATARCTARKSSTVMLARVIDMAVRVGKKLRRSTKTSKPRVLSQMA